MASLWRESGLDFADFLPEAEDIHTFLSQQVGGEVTLCLSSHFHSKPLIRLCQRNQKLQFVFSDGSGPDAAAAAAAAVAAAAASERILSPGDLSQQLDRLLLEDMASDEQIFDWVEV